MGMEQLSKSEVLTNSNGFSDGIRDIGTMRKHKSKTAPKEACLNYSYFQWSEIDSHFKISKGYNLSSDEICSESDKSMVCLVRFSQ